MPVVVGKQVPVKEGLRVIMAAGLPDQGTGTITALLDGGARVSVRWDSGSEDASISTGQNGQYDLEAAVRVQENTLSFDGAMQAVGYADRKRTLSSPAAPPLLPSVARSAQKTTLTTSQRVSRNSSFDAPNSPAVVPSSPSVGGSDTLHKQLLAQEVVKLRKELDDLKAAKAFQQTQSVIDRQREAEDLRSQMLMRLRNDVEVLERARDSVVAQATQQKSALAQEVKTLRQELESAQKEGANRAARAQMEAMLATPVGQALAARREFEERFTHALRDLRAQLEASSIKSLSQSAQAPVGVRSLLQVSNERIDGAMKDATRIPVEERLHIECLRLVIENGKLRKALNEYTQGLLENALVKEEGFTPKMNVNGNMFITNLGGGSFFSSLFV